MWNQGKRVIAGRWVRDSEEVTQSSRVDGDRPFDGKTDARHRARLNRRPATLFGVPSGSATKSSFSSCRRQVKVPSRSSASMPVHLCASRIAPYPRQRTTQKHRRFRSKGHLRGNRTQNAHHSTLQPPPRPVKGLSVDSKYELQSPPPQASANTLQKLLRLASAGIESEKGIENK